MRKQEKKENRGRQLRDAAEETLARIPGAPPEVKEKNLEEIVHELQVHQIELEMQNEELRRAQLASEESRSKYMDLYDFSPVGYFTFTREALITEVNRTGAALLSAQRQKLINGRFRRFVASGDQDLWDQHIMSVLKKGEKQSCDLVLRRADGTTFHARLDSIRMEGNGETPVIRTIISDITERKRAELQEEITSEVLELLGPPEGFKNTLQDENGEALGCSVKAIIGSMSGMTNRKQAKDELKSVLKQLQNAKDMVVQSEKMAAIGQLAAGMSHEVLTPSAIIEMELQFMELEENTSEEMKHSISVCHEQVNRIIRVTRDMGKFARLTESERNPANINQVIENILAISSPRFGLEGVNLDVQYGSELPLIPIDVNRIEQVFFNIINNAIDSMLDQELKVLRVETGKVAPTGGREYLRIVFTDTGKGVLPEHLTRVFDPFFTTKCPETGTGLGLSVSRGIIHEHGGRIWVENNERGGASFFIELPVL